MTLPRIGKESDIGDGDWDSLREQAAFLRSLNQTDSMWSEKVRMATLDTEKCIHVIQFKGWGTARKMWVLGHNVEDSVYDKAYESKSEGHGMITVMRSQSEEWLRQINTESGHSAFWLRSYASHPYYFRTTENIQNVVVNEIVKWFGTMRRRTDSLTLKVGCDCRTNDHAGKYTNSQLPKANAIGRSVWSSHPAAHELDRELLVALNNGPSPL
jgi:hypothetical protein